MEKTNTPQKDSVRLSTVLELLGISPYKMAKELGYKSPASIYNVVNEEGNASLSVELANKIVAKYPNVNYLYLTKGKGAPMLTHPSEIDSQRKLFATEESKDQEQDRLRHQEPEKPSSYMSYQLEQLVKNSYELNLLIRDLLYENKKLREKLEEKI